MTLRSVLMFSYVFPPLGGGGVYRTLKFVKYLPRHGYGSVIVTTRGRWYPPRDESLLAEIPEGTRVVHAAELPVARLRELVMNPLHRLGLARALDLIGWPDPYAGWILGAVWSGLRAVRRFRPDVVYSTSPPVSAHVAALIVSRLTGLPWVADFRDAWTLSPEHARLPRPVARANARFEEAIVKHASRLVVADESIGLRRVGSTSPRRMPIGNGFDPEDLPASSNGRDDSMFRLAYVGTLYGARNAEPVFAAVKSVIERGEVDRNELEVRLVGSDFRARIGGSHLEALPVRATGYVDHRAAVAEMASADALLLYQPPGWQGASGKAYEYLATGRPILCVTPDDSTASRLVRDLGAGECARPDDQAGIETAITTLYRRWQHGELGVNEEVRRDAFGRFSRDALAGRLAQVLDAAVDEGVR